MTTAQLLDTITFALEVVFVVMVVAATVTLAAALRLAGKISCKEE